MGVCRVVDARTGTWSVEMGLVGGLLRGLAGVGGGGTNLPLGVDVEEEILFQLGFMEDVDDFLGDIDLGRGVFGGAAEGERVADHD